MTIATMLPLGDQINPGQMRLALVQVVNWGTFHGAHTMHVDRNGTLLTGNSGVGKSTLFDAMLRVFDARPRSNEAAAQRSGGAVEDKRTTFTYMRGKVGDKAVGEGSASAFQRPGATWSAVALTFDNAAGTKVTVSALFDLPKNGTESSVGRFYVIDSKPLDLEAIEGIAQKRFTKGALEGIFPDGQVFDVHKAFAERFRRLLGINSDQALPLLRVIQAGKGLGGSVNTFFRDQVLDAPATLAAADDVVEEFSNLMSIRQRLEDVRQQRDQLAPVPGLNKEYAQALLEANRLRELAGEEFVAYKQQLAVTVHAKTLARFKELTHRPKRRSLPASGRSGRGWPRSSASWSWTTTTVVATLSRPLSSRWRTPAWGSSCASRWRRRPKKHCPTPVWTLSGRPRAGIRRTSRPQPISGIEGRLGGLEGASFRSVRRPCNQEARTGGS